MYVFSNIRSLLPKLDEVHLTSITYSCAIFALVETWLSPDITDSELIIPGYSLFRLDRNRHGGGVAIYVHCSLHATLLPCTNPFNLNLELILLKITSLSARVIGVYYRPPHCPDSLSALHQTLQSLSPSMLRNLTIFGDFNVDMLTPCHHLMPNLKLILDSFNLTQIVSEPTHSSYSGRKSLLDLVLTSDSSLVVSHSVLPHKQH